MVQATLGVGCAALGLRGSLGCDGLAWLCALLQKQTFRPESKQDYPPNLSILISGGKENNCDALSNGE